MSRKFKSSIHFGDSSDEEAEEKLTLVNFDSKKNDILLVPWTVKLTTPYLIYHFPDLIQFLRYDLRKYPKVKHVENAPYPSPFLEVFNMEGRLLHEVDLAFKSRGQLNQILQDYNQLPKDTVDWLIPPSRPHLNLNPDIGLQYQPMDLEDEGVNSHERYSLASSVDTNFTASTPDTVISE